MSKSDRDAVSARLIAALRAVYPQKTAASVFADLQCAGVDISEHGVAKWFSRASLPSLEIFGAMGAIYGPEFTASVFPAWAPPAAAERAGLRARLQDVLKEANRLVDQVSDF